MYIIYSFYADHIKHHVLWVCTGRALRRALGVHWACTGRALIWKRQPGAQNHIKYCIQSRAPLNLELLAGESRMLADTHRRRHQPRQTQKAHAYILKMQTTTDSADHRSTLLATLRITCYQAPVLIFPGIQYHPYVC